MGIFDGHISITDWDGNGKIDAWDDIFELQQMMFIQNETERQNREFRISRIVSAITRDGEDKQIGNEEFEELCRQEGLNIYEFEQSDIEEIQRRLDRW